MSYLRYEDAYKTDALKNPPQQEEVVKGFMVGKVKKNPGVVRSTAPMCMKCGSMEIEVVMKDPYTISEKKCKKCGFIFPY